MGKELSKKMMMMGCVKGELLGWREDSSGITHILVLGLVLFNIFIYDLGTKNRVLIKFADDAKGCGIVNIEEDQNIVQEELNNFEDWSN